MKPSLVILAAAIAAAAPLEAQDLEPVPYNHPGLVVDLGVGLWAWPLPMDYDGDGDMDLLVACPDKPSNGVYLFENPEGDVKLPTFRPGVRLGPATHNMQVSYVGARARVLGPGLEYVGFQANDFDKTLRIHANSNPHGAPVRANMWRYVDFDGDGDQDLVVGAGDWADYGWDDAHDRRGVWRNGPLHGFVYLLANRGDDDAPVYAAPARLQAGGGDLDVYGWPSPCFADFDADGDLDLICGEFVDGFTYFENTGSRRAPVYSSGRRLTVGDRPLRMDLQMITPVAVDWDRDGDPDLVVGDEDGRVALIEHTGAMERGNPLFREPVYFRQEAADLKFGALATPFSFDWDGDGDQDLLCGNTAGYIGFFENLGGGEHPRWDRPRFLEAAGQVIRIQAGAYGSVQGPCEAKWGYTTLSASDWDHDGLPDLLVNSILGEVLWYRNAGSRSAPVLEGPRHVEAAWPGTPPKPRWTWWDPAGEQVVTQWRTTPLAVDFTGDGWNDLVMLDHEGYLALWERRRTPEGALALLPPRRAFLDERGRPLRLNSRSAGRSGRRKLAVVDWDGDGRLDLLVDSENATWYRNLETRGDQHVLRVMGRLGRRNIAGHTSSPATCDWNGDGTPDLIVGAEDGRIYFMSHDDAVSHDTPDETPEPAAGASESAARPGIVKEEYVFRTAPFAQCHAATLVQTARGLVAAWFGGTREKHSDVGIWVSVHDGDGWSRPKEVADGVQHGSLRYPCWNPVLFQPPGDAPTSLFFKVGPSPSQWWGERILSFDGGRTWRDRERLPEEILGPIKNKPLLLADGALLCGSSTEHDGWRVHFERSDDLGATWSRTAPLNDGAAIQAIQPSVLVHPDDRLQAIGRSKQDRLWQCWSEDGGRTWGEMTLTTLPNPGAGADALTLADGRHLLVYNHTLRHEGEFRARNMLNVALSRDGITWSAALVLEREKGAEFSYPAVIQTDDGRVHVAYTYKRRRIKHVVLDPAKLEQHPIQEGRWPVGKGER